MSWRETVKSRSEGGLPLVGRFRQARFIVPGAEARVGRRTEVHEYPLRDKPYVEDLGRSARRFEVEVFVDATLGGDYQAARDALIEALETAGPGTLVHPWYGTLQVALAEPASVRESTREGGRATFRISFIEAGELRFPTAGSDTQTAVDRQADAALAVAAEDFAESWDVEGLPAWSLEELESDIYGTLADLEAQVGDVAASVAAAIRAPANMATAILGSLSRLQSIVTEPMRALQLYSTLFGAGSDSPSVPATTATRRQQAANSAALHRLVQRGAVIEAARVSSQAPAGSASAAGYVSSADAKATFALLTDALDEQMEAADPVTGRPVSDAVYSALHALRTAVAADLRSRGARLPELTHYTPDATVPALVVAHRLYGDAARCPEICERNGIRHPGFVPGGQALEVLND